MLCPDGLCKRQKLHVNLFFPDMIHMIHIFHQPADRRHQTGREITGQKNTQRQNRTDRRQNCRQRPVEDTPDAVGFSGHPQHIAVRQKDRIVKGAPLHGGRLSDRPALSLPQRFRHLRPPRMIVHPAYIRIAVVEHCAFRCDHGGADIFLSMAVAVNVSVIFHCRRIRSGIRHIICGHIRYDIRYFICSHCPAVSQRLGIDPQILHHLRLKKAVKHHRHQQQRDHDRHRRQKHKLPVNLFLHERPHKSASTQTSTKSSVPALRLLHRSSEPICYTDPSFSRK